MVSYIGEEKIWTNNKKNILNKSIKIEGKNIN